MYYLNMKTFSGMYPFSSLYFLRAFIIAGRMELAYSWPDSWNSQLLVNLIRIKIIMKTKPKL